MKKLIIIAIALISIQSIAQKKGNHKMNDFTPEEIATLKTKKMTLHLDLNKSQQSKIHDIVLEDAKIRKEKMEARKAKKENESKEKPSKEERLKMMNARLDYQIAMKAKMKSILNEDQFAKWEKMHQRKNHKNKQRKQGREGKEGKRHH